MRAPVLIAAATGAGIGLGHLRRCEALAEAMPGSRLLRLRDGDDGWLAEVPGGATVVLDMLHHGNAAATVRAVTALRAAGAKVAVIDSMPPDHYPETASAEAAPDWLITPYVAAHRLRPPPTAGNWLHGPEFAILPSEYAAARARLDQVAADRILIACGAVDPTGLSHRIAQHCVAGSAPVDLIVGPDFSPDLRAALDRLAARHPGLHLHRAPGSLLPVFLTARLVIGRPGLIRYEAAALGRPALYLAEGAAYHAYFRAFNDAGIARVFLADDPGGADAFLARVRDLVSGDAGALPPVPDPVALEAVDARGAGRVSLALSQS